MSERIASFDLRGAGGEPISFARTIHSHGVARLPPALKIDDPSAYRVMLRLAGIPRAVTFRADADRLHAYADRRLSKRAEEEARVAARRIFRLDEDLAPFYTRIVAEPDLAWAANGAGRLLASPTVFEEVIKTVCTTNCAWSGTVRMVTALVEDLGGGAFPTPQMMAGAREAWYRDVARAGYRGAYLRTLGKDVASGALDLEALRPEAGLSDEACEERLLELPGVGPYAAAHIMLLIGRYHRLILDSWTRPTYLRLAGKKRAKDATIKRAFKRYGEHGGLAFWLFLTRDWVAEGRNGAAETEHI